MAFPHGFTELGNGGFRVGPYIARPLADNLEWGVGAINYASTDPAERLWLAATAVGSLDRVDSSQESLSACTDGRLQMKMENGRWVPVRQQSVGASIVMGFAMAEAAGEAFYGDPTAPIEERIEATAQGLLDRGIQSSTHEPCGAKVGLLPIHHNILTFAHNPNQSLRDAYRTRNAILLGEAYQSPVEEKFLDDLNGRMTNLGQYGYDRYDPAMLTRAVRNTTGPEGNYNVEVTDHGQHGHLEGLILRLSRDVGLVALNVTKLADSTAGRHQAFGNNDGLLDEVAAAIGRGDADVVSIARHAGEHFTNAGHGTLAKDLPTWRVSTASAKLL
jgi:hypothetical protein